MRAPSILALAALVSGCAQEQAPAPAAQQAQAQPTATATATATAAATAKPKADEAPLQNFTENDFVESEDSRDPFRDYLGLFRKPIEELGKQSGRKVKAAGYALDELRLMGIITEHPQSRALLADSTGFGWIVYTGDFVGKAELVNTGGTEGQEVPLNWKVDRIRDGDVVFVREDPTHPQIARTTRVLPLYAASESTHGS